MAKSKKASGQAAPLATPIPKPPPIAPPNGNPVSDRARHKINELCTDWTTQFKNNATIHPDTKVQGLSERVIEHVEDNYGFFLRADGTRYVYDEISGSLYRVSFRDETFMAWLCRRFGLRKSGASAGQTREVIDLIERRCDAAPERPVARSTFYRPESATLFLSNRDGTMWRIGVQNIDRVPNGQGIVFLDDDIGEPCTKPVIGNNGVLLKTLVDDLEWDAESHLTPQSQRVLFTLWMFATAFPALFPGKPMLVVTGEKGSGKTVAIQRLQRAILGAERTHGLSDRDEKEFPVKLLRSPICLIDNTDRYVPWLPDALCSYLTGGTFVQRKLYTDGDEAVIKPESFVAAATKNPASFRRDDVADRSIVIRLARRQHRSGYRALSAIWADIETRRPLLYGEWLHHLQAIVIALDAEQRNPTVVTTTSRMSDFARFALVAGPALGFTTDEIHEALDAAQSERETLTTEDDALLNLISWWLETTKNQGRSIEARELFQELTLVATRYEQQMPIRTALTLSRRLRRPETRRVLDVRREKTRDRNLYRIWYAGEGPGSDENDDDVPA